MSKHFIQVTCLPGPPPLDIIITAEQLTHYYNAQTIVDNANRKSAHILADLEQKTARTHSDMRRIREQARQAGLSEAKEEIDRLRADTIAQTVEWLIEEDELECNVAKSLDLRLCALVTRALASWFSERNLVEDVMQRVRLSLEKMPDEDLATLYVPPEVNDAVREQLGTMPRVRIQTDASLTPGQARLESRLALIRFDLDAHHQLILERLSSS